MCLKNTNILNSDSLECLVQYLCSLREYEDTYVNVGDIQCRSHMSATDSSRFVDGCGNDFVFVSDLSLYSFNDGISFFISIKAIDTGNYSLEPDLWFRITVFNKNRNKESCRLMQDLHDFCKKEISSFENNDCIEEFFNRFTNQIALLAL